MKKEHINEVVKQMLEEWKRGMLTFWTLGLISIRSMYGLEIKKEIETSSDGRMKLGASTIYQLLRRLEKRGLVKSRWEATVYGPPRAYYEATDPGKAVVKYYIEEVLSPGSPIASALGKLTAQLMQSFTH